MIKIYVQISDNIRTSIMFADSLNEYIRNIAKPLQAVRKIDGKNV